MSQNDLKKTVLFTEKCIKDSVGRIGKINQDQKITNHGSCIGFTITSTTSESKNMG